MISNKYLTKNETYIKPTAIKPQYIIVHSTGVGYKNKDVLFNNWNAPDKLSIHGMVDDAGAYHTLPLTYLAWHVGKSGNSKTIGFEICEPSNMAYANANHTKVDAVKYNPKDAKNIADFNKRWENAVEMAVYFCKETGLTADKVISHAEGYKKGVASNHADTAHWFSLFGKTMDDFRADVNAELNKVVKKIYRVQVGAFSIKENAEKMKAKLKADGYDAIIV